MFMVADLTDIIPGVFLRLFVDMAVDESTGKSWFLATVAQLDPDSGAPPNSHDSTAFELYEDERGWAIVLEGNISHAPDGGYFVQTNPTTVTVLVHGFLWVQLQDFRFEATVSPGAGEAGRDSGEGLLSTSRILLNDPDDPDDLGEGTAALMIDGVFPDEIATALPQLCEENPCAEMKALGGDCQLADPWKPVPPCQ
jgi:hypothetical protein